MLLSLSQRFDSNFTGFPKNFPGIIAQMQRGIKVIFISNKSSLKTGIYEFN
jgi:hypothetical protein